ncbi:MAG: hydrogenase nickel incorporation protein HypA [Candidatus Methanomethylophilaceae archaeon]|nr:hydrogenase nickel incorporation protein HypA [Candidatus Methanomethylophilaceae archaeon]
MSEFNSAELANGKSIGLNGEIRGFNADVEARLADVLMQVGRWVERESGALMGHIKMAVTNGDQTVTMNLTDIDEGVLFHGKVRPSQTVQFSFMAAVLDVDDHELEHRTLHAFEDSGIMMDIHEHSSSHHHHHHDHGPDCTCGCHDHDHDHEHHHDHEHGPDCTCGCHDHDHDHEHHHDGEECHCHDHDEDGEHHHHHDGEHHHHHDD